MVGRGDAAGQLDVVPEVTRATNTDAPVGWAVPMWRTSDFARRARPSCTYFCVVCFVTHPGGGCGWKEGMKPPKDVSGDGQVEQRVVTIRSCTAMPGLVNSLRM